MRRIVILFILTLGGLAAQSPFAQKPYLQLGNAAYPSKEELMSVLWHTADRDADWKVEVRQGGDAWRQEPAYVLRRVNVRGLQPHRVYHAILTNLLPGQEFQYRVLLNSKSVFASQGRARRAPGDPHQFAIYGDMSEDSSGQKALAYQIYRANPEYLVSVGDLVYSRGLASQYYEKYFPIYNCDEPIQGKCAPILRSILTLAIPGNHDIPNQVNFGSLPDALAYYYYWSQPLNGPVIDRNAGNAPELKGRAELIREFTRSAPNFPRMGMFSFEYGDVHWLMLDSDEYVDWTDPKLREWVRKDLQAASKAAWRMVAMHHPAFQSARKHFDQQWMRQMVDIFQAGRVDIVFAGHVHNYQRSYPLRFTIKPEDATESARRAHRFEGDVQIDRNYNGQDKTKPNGIIHIVTGAGGASLVGGGESDPSRWQEYTAAYEAKIHSFTLVEESAQKLTIRQISKDAKEIDRFVVTR